jgi:hypothetical protein
MATTGFVITEGVSANARRIEANETKLVSFLVKSRRGRKLRNQGQGTFSMDTGLDRWNQQQLREVWWSQAQRLAHGPDSIN